jgi:hypothetical protein
MLPVRGIGENPVDIEDDGGAGRDGFGSPKPM